MSWQAYVDTNLVGSGKVSKAVILGQKGGVWATSSGFNLSASEQQKIVGAFANPDNARASGVTASGVKYLVLQVTDRSIYGKKAADGIVIVKTVQAVLVAVYNAPIQGQECISVVESLADYLISVGY
ncbi:hypothetical protein JAAARDRAFT_37543 [Jaapia argillacea MUCL 33604]|uniref:Profilin n=1 Tax=Jaapia argillacea MUCL 33604 TaxID=933084 RepID=A0A067PW76_9AGAM|nr:hypothetical protein JAAARDRAFT_37543 [Jaapia argillacea MUCL 33604]